MVYNIYMISYEPLYSLLTENNKAMSTLSLELGYSKTTISNIAARHGGMSASMLDKICSYFSCKPGDVFEIVSDDTLIEHKRTCNQSKRKPRLGGAASVKVDWEKLTKAIAKKGYVYRTLSVALGKNPGFIGRKKQCKHIAPQSLDLITSFLDLDSREFIIDKVQ